MIKICRNSTKNILILIFKTFNLFCIFEKFAVFRNIFCKYQILFKKGGFL